MDSKYIIIILCLANLGLFIYSIIKGGWFAAGVSLFSGGWFAWKWLG